jgi:hypothetical protein
MPKKAMDRIVRISTDLRSRVTAKLIVSASAVFLLQIALSYKWETSMRSWPTIVLLGFAVLPLVAQQHAGRGGFNGNGYGGAQVPPGTYLNGVPSRPAAPGLNGLPAFSNRNYHFGCYPNCAPARGNRNRTPYVGFVPLFNGYVFPQDVYQGDDSAGPIPPPVDPTAVAITNELDQLRGEVSQLKAQTAPAPPSVPDAAQPPQPPEPATVIVLRDGRRIETTNYAVMDSTLWNFSARPIQKIPTGAIDVSASEKANADRGVDFSLSFNATN